LQLQEGKENGIETDERKDDSIVYADLDKSAMSSASATKVAVENEKTAYAEIKPETKEKWKILQILSVSWEDQKKENSGSYKSSSFSEIREN